MTGERDWAPARAKLEEEGACRLRAWAHRYGACDGPLAAAHVIGRRHDRLVVGPRGGERLVVAADDVVPLCLRHHTAYDRHELDLLPHLTREEQVAAVGHVGIAGALRRVTGGSM